MPLEATTQGQAQDELGKLKRDRRAGKLKIVVESRGFTEFADHYLATIQPTMNSESYPFSLPRQGGWYGSDLRGSRGGCPW